MKFTERIRKPSVRRLTPLHGIAAFVIIMLLFLFVFAPLQYYFGMLGLALTELGDCLPASGGVEQEVEAAALAESLNRFLEALPQEKRVLFVRRYWYLCSVEELAAWSGRRRGTVSAALFRLRQDLREHLEREGFTL